MPVNGIELKEGQIWEDNVRIQRTIKRNPSGSVDFPWIGENTEGGGYSTLTNDGRFNGVDYSYYDLNKLIYNPESEEKTAMTNKFNPQPGDKIICNNGEEYICCTLETLMQKYPKAQIMANKTIYSYKENDGVVTGWQSWYITGEAHIKIHDNCDVPDYNIREVIPQNVEVSANKKEEVQEEPRYSLQEIKEAWDASGWVISTSAWEVFQKNLTKINSPEYQEYLRLKAIYE